MAPVRNVINDDEIGAPTSFRFFWTSFILFLATAPYFINAYRTSPGYTYDWMIPPYPVDTHAYRAWARQAYDGHWLFTLKFTALHNPRIIFLPFFLVAGLLAKISGADIGLVFLLMKSLGIVVFFASFFRLLRHFRLSPLQSIAASIFVGVSAGLGGWTPTLFPEGLSRNWTPVDLWLVDSNTFWCLLWNPLYPFSLALMLMSLIWADESVSSGKKPTAWLSGACLGALALIHPYPLVVLYPLLTIICIARRPKDWQPFWFRIIGASLPSSIYVAAVAIFDPMLRRHNALGTADAITPFAYLSGLGFLPWLTAAGAIQEKKFFRRYWPLLSWIGISAVLSYSSIWFQTKYIFGAHVALCVLAGAATEPILSSLGWKPRPAAACVALLLLAMPYTLTIHLRESLAMAAQNIGEDYYLSPEMKQALQYLEAHSSHSAVVFADPQTSAKVCAFAGNTVMWGHWAQAVDFEERQGWMRNIFSLGSGLNDAERLRLFWNSGVDYLFLDGRWRQGFKTAPAAGLLQEAKKIFENSEVSIYQHDAGPS
ncbi:MAG: hypothetical protein HKL90_02210 [Elusimicrobia bacterium]|nr:hypothetical protein [Elusimicrobiota bacterium]